AVRAHLQGGRAEPDEVQGGLNERTAAETIRAGVREDDRAHTHDNHAARTGETTRSNEGKRRAEVGEHHARRSKRRRDGDITAARIETRIVGVREADE